LAQVWLKAQAITKALSRATATYSLTSFNPLNDAQYLVALRDRISGQCIGASQKVGH